MPRSRAFLLRRDLVGRAVLLGVLLAVGAAALLWWGAERDYRRVEAWLPQLEAAAQEAGADPWLLAGLVYAESRGQPEAVSSAGAMGLCQLMPSTAEELALRLDLPGPPYSPEHNLAMGATYLAELMRRFDEDVELALLAYRLGPTRVRRTVAEEGREAWLRRMAEEPPSPWGYVVQVKQSGERLRLRAARR